MSTILTTIRWLSIFTGALSLFYLGHAWFEFGLGEVFTRIYAWYAGILHPVVELLKPAALWLVGLVDWTLPFWWKEVVVLYLAMGGAMARGAGYRYRSLRKSLSEWEVSQGQSPSDLGDDAVKKHREAVRREELHRAALLPLRLVFWPAFWVIDLSNLVAEFLRVRTVWWIPERVQLGYITSNIVEFAKILAGALIFAAINAGFG